MAADEHLRRPEVLDNARKRARLTRAIRAFFDGREFVEVETGQLVDEPGQEPRLRPFVAASDGPFLITSPELRMKRLLAAGWERIYELCHCFRSGLGERSSLHHPEFTMLEWYRAAGSADDLVRDLEVLLPACAQAVEGAPQLAASGISVDVPFERITVAHAFERHAGVDLNPFLDGDGAGFVEGVRNTGFPGVSSDDDATSVFFRVFLDRIEPRLGFERPVVVDAWPASMAALARLDPADERVAQRFELFVAGVELANAFVELTDVDEQRRRFERDRELKRASGADPGPMPEQFLNALASMPDAVGIALGVDRLLMLIVGAVRIDDVLLFPDPPEPV